MTPTDRAALREAVEVACVVMARLPQHEKQYQTLRAFLNSGLSDAERETVGKVVAEMASRIVWPAGAEGPTALDMEVAEWLAALRPIAEGGKE